MVIENRMKPIKCEKPCQDVGAYEVCYQENWQQCNILNGKAVTYQDGTPANVNPINWRQYKGLDESGLTELVIDNIRKRGGL